MGESTTIVAFDQHAAKTVAAVLLPGQRTPALHPMTSALAELRQFVRRLRRQGAVRCCHEAGPCASLRRGSAKAPRIRGARPLARVRGNPAVSQHPPLRGLRRIALPIRYAAAPYSIAARRRGCAGC